MTITKQTDSIAITAAVSEFLEAAPLSAKDDVSCKAAQSLTRRLIPKHAYNFSFKNMPKEAGCDVFEISKGQGNTILIRGSSTIAMTSGFHWYLKHVVKCHVSWCGDQLNLPDRLKPPKETIRRDTRYEHGFYLNYCTFNYTMAWWDWERWEREIDYMALCGIDMPLAIVGSEALWVNVLKRFGYTHDEAKGFVCGPAYTAWMMMGNLEERGGPITDEWMNDKVALQNKILSRMHEFGMKPALPGFVGLVPTSFSKKNPGNKTLPQGNWVGCVKERPHVLHPDAALFDQFAKAWYEELEKLYGKADAFAGDLFHEGGKSHGIDVQAYAKQVQSYMLEHNPKSIWTLQGWQGNPEEKLLSSLKKDNTLVVELCCEYYRNWETTTGFYGYPWTFSTIIMYGGNIGLHGRLKAISQNLNDALASRNPPIALGATWESIEINPVIMDFIWDMRWRDKCPDIYEWLADYTTRRYGVDVPKLKEAWKKLLDSGYGSNGHRRPQEPVFCAKPSLTVKSASPWGSSQIHYDQRILRDAAKLLLEAEAEAGDSRPYKFDVLDVTRQFLSNAGQVAYSEMVAAFTKKDTEAFDEASSTFLEMMKDQDDLLASEELYLLGRWLNDARRIAPNHHQANQNERNARLLITVWNEEDSQLRDYAWKEWNGLLARFYIPRWSIYIKSLREQLNGKKGDPIDLYPFEVKWARQYSQEDRYPHKATGDPVEKSKHILNKWSPWLDKHYVEKRDQNNQTSASSIGTNSTNAIVIQ